MNLSAFLRNSFFLAALALFPLAALPASEGFPLKEILVQAFNFSVFAGLFALLARKPAGLLFHKRQEEFLAFERRAEKEEREKKSELAEWQKKLKGLEDQEKGIKKKAREEGEKLALQKKEELKSLESRLKREREFLTHLEREKAKKALLLEWRGKIAGKARGILEERARSPDLQKKKLEDFLKGLEGQSKKRAL